jgi:hypothetical protein
VISEAPPGDYNTAVYPSNDYNSTMSGDYRVALYGDYTGALLGDYTGIMSMRILG